MSGTSRQLRATLPCSLTCRHLVLSFPSFYVFFFLLDSFPVSFLFQTVVLWASEIDRCSISSFHGQKGQQPRNLSFLYAYLRAHHHTSQEVSGSLFMQNNEVWGHLEEILITQYTKQPRAGVECPLVILAVSAGSSPCLPPQWSREGENFLKCYGFSTPMENSFGIFAKCFRDYLVFL